MFNTARASFHTLPNEMLINIAKFSDTFRDFSSLARVNRQAFTLLERYLFQHEVSTESGRSAALFWALTACEIDEDLRLLVVNRAIDAGVDVNMGIDLSHFKNYVPSVSIGLTICAVGIAIGRSCFRVACRMLEVGADSNLELSPGVTPLLENIMAKKKDAVEFLLKQPGINLYSTPPEGDSILERAVTHSTADIVKLLIPHLDLSRREYFGGIWLFILAVQSQDPQMVSAMLSSTQLNPNHRFVTNHDRRLLITVFTIACTMDNSDVLRLLHDDHRVDPDIPDGDGYNLGVVNAWNHRQMNHVEFLMRSTRSKTAKASIFCLAFNHGNTVLAKKVLRLACAEIARQP